MERYELKTCEGTCSGKKKKFSGSGTLVANKMENYQRFALNLLAFAFQCLTKS